MNESVERLAAMSERLGGFSEVMEREAACEKHGVFVSRRFFGSIWTRCPACETDIRAKEDEARAQADRERAALAWRATVTRSGIPQRFEDRTFDSYVAESNGQGAALEFARAFGDEVASGTANGRCAVFVGKPGTGKTHLAVAIALRAMEGRRTAAFTTVTRLIRRIRDTYNKTSLETETQAVAAFTSPDLLILDEVGVQRGTEDEKLLLFDVLNDRYETRKSTVLLSNLAAAELRGYLGDRVFDRMREDGGRVIVFDWNSHRGAA